MEDEFIEGLRQWCIDHPLTKEELDISVEVRNLGKEVWTGQKHSTNTRKKMSKKGKNRVTCLNTITGERTKVSKEEFDQNEHLVGINTNRKFESRPNHAKFMKENGKVPTFKGMKHSDEHKRMMSEKMKRIWNERKNNIN